MGTLKQLEKVITWKAPRPGSRPLLLSSAAAVAQQKHDIDLTVGRQEVEGDLLRVV